MAKNSHPTLYIKYFFDKIIALAALLGLFPVFLVTGLILKIQGEDVFYLQERVGQEGKSFKVFKFTTMPKGSEKQGLITTTNDPRPTPFGHFLRKTKINELPQLINVVLGEMSIIGPRPIIRSQLLESLTEDEIRQYYRMRPGITGMASFHFHHEDRLLAAAEDPKKFFNTVLMPQKKELEINYAKHWSLLLDLKILLGTIGVLVLDVFNKGVKD